MKNPLEEVKDITSQAAFGMTRNDAWSKGLCIKCKQAPQFYSDAGRKEYGITGLCEFCFDLICDPDVCSFCGLPSSFHAHNRAGACERFVFKPSDYIGD